MKKYTLGIGVAIIFVAYSIAIRHQRSEAVVAPVVATQNTPTPSFNSSQPTTPTTNTSSQYKDGTFTGSDRNAFYGNVQISATIQNGKIVSVNFLDYPRDNPNSISINEQAMPYLKQEAIRSQNANVSIVSGATLTSQAFMQSLADALNQAKQG